MAGYFKVICMLKQVPPSKKLHSFYISDNIHFFRFDLRLLMT